MAIRGRRNRRFVFEDATVEYRKHSSLPFLGGSPKVSPLINLSVGGLQFIAEDFFDPGQRLDLKIMLPSAFRSVTVRAEAVWARRVVGRDCYRTGVRYIDPSAADVSLLRSLEEQYWAIPDERKQQFEAIVNERYPLQGGEMPAPAGQPPEAEPEATPAPAPADGAAEETPVEGAEAPPGTEAAPAPPESPPARSAQPLSVPLYDLIAGVQSKEGEQGFVLQGTPKAELLLPGISDTDCFAFEVHDDSMHHTGSPSFARGDIVVFSSSRPARSGDLAFAITRDGGVFRQVFFDANNVVRLRPLNGWHAEQTFSQGEVTALWKLIAKVKKYVAE